MDMPEKIYAYQEVIKGFETGTGTWCNMNDGCKEDQATEYIRADKVNQMAKEHEMMREALKFIAKYGELDTMIMRHGIDSDDYAQQALDKLGENE